MSVSATLISTPTTLKPAARSDVGRRYVAAAVQTGIGGIVSRMLQGFTPIILARYLGPKEYGVYALVLSLVNIVAGVSHLGQNAALQKLLPEYSVKNPLRGGAILANTVIVISGSLAVLCATFFFASNWIASNIYHDRSLAAVFQFSALLVLTLSLFNLASSVTAGLQDFKTFSHAMILRSAAFLGLGWLGVWLLGLYGAVLGQLLASVLGLALLTAHALDLARQRFPGPFRPQLSGEILKEIFSFAFPAFLAGLLVSPAYWWANTLLARHGGFEQVGLFAVAFALAQLIMLIPLNLSIPAVSFMSEAYVSERREEFSRLVGTNLRLIWALTLPMAVGCALFAPLLVPICFGPAYRAATPLVFPMSFVALLMVINGMVGNAIAGSGRMWHAFVINLFWLGMFVLFGYFLIPRWGSWGLSINFALSYLFFTVGVWFYSRRFLGVVYERLRRLVLLTSVAAAGVGVAFFLPKVHGESFLYLLFIFCLTLALWASVCREEERAILRVSCFQKARRLASQFS
jgi:O-antigen/teichoic acid export membrane protein